MPWSYSHCVSLRSYQKNSSQWCYTITPSDLYFKSSNISVALVVTLGHNLEAYTISSSSGIIIDCGASSHFSPDKSKFINYCEIDPEPIRAADGHTFSAMGKGDIQIRLPINNNSPAKMIILKDMFYAPEMAFTLISVSCLDKGGCTISIEDGLCLIKGPRPN